MNCVDTIDVIDVDIIPSKTRLMENSWMFCNVVHDSLLHHKICLRMFESVSIILASKCLQSFIVRLGGLRPAQCL